MQRIVILGRGAAGKTTAAAQLGRALALPVCELDQCFWSDKLAETPPAEWMRVQQELAAADRWIMDGDLGPYDVVAPRLHRADTVVIFDFGLARCAWRALRRSRERTDFWWWLITWRRRSRPGLLRAISEHAPRADLHRITSPRGWRRFLATATRPDHGPNPRPGSRQFE